MPPNYKANLNDILKQLKDLEYVASKKEEEFRSDP